MRPTPDSAAICDLCSRRPAAGYKEGRLIRWRWSDGAERHRLAETEGKRIRAMRRWVGSS